MQVIESDNKSSPGIGSPSSFTDLVANNLSVTQTQIRVVSILAAAALVAEETQPSIDRVRKELRNDFSNASSYAA